MDESQRRAFNNDGMDPDWRPPPPPAPQQFVPLEDYEHIGAYARRLQTLLKEARNEITDRWDPLVKKLRKESAQFQHDMMTRHEKYVEAATRVKELRAEIADNTTKLKNEINLLTDSNRSLLEQLTALQNQESLPVRSGPRTECAECRDNPHLEPNHRHILLADKQPSTPPSAALSASICAAVAVQPADLQGAPETAKAMREAESDAQLRERLRRRAKPSRTDF